MALEDKTFHYIPPTSLSIETVHRVNESHLELGEKPEKRHTVALGSQAKDFLGNLKPGDKVILSNHESNVFIYGPIDESKLYTGKYWA